MDTKLGKHGIIDLTARRYIFKYQPIKDYSKTNLKNNKLWASNPSAFNDPFEFQYKNIGKNPLTSDIHILIDQIHQSKVVCLTSDPFNLLMWSHYADNHKGMCLGFYDQTITSKVNYSDEFPNLNFDKNDKDEIMQGLVKILFTKSPQWKYEKERRMIFMPNIPPEVKYPGELFLIIFGMRTDQNVIDEIKSLISDPDVLFWKCKRASSHYKIEFEIA